MRRILLAFLFVFAVVDPTSAMNRDESHPIRILFVGNSLTYVGNLPSVFLHLAAANQKMIETDMIVRGGSTLSERVDDGSVAQALQAKHYDYLILQERGGDALGAFGEASQKQAQSALQKLATIAATHRTKAFYLSSYQPLPQMTKILLDAERAMAAQASVDYIDVQSTFIEGKNTFPNAEWLHADKGHPGHDLILLEAVLLFTHLIGDLPKACELRINAPMYAPNTSFTAPAPTTLARITSDIAMFHHYREEQLATIIKIAQTKVE